MSSKEITKDVEQETIEQGTGKIEDKEQVDKTKENVKTTTGKLLGGITGKGFMPGISGNPKGRTPGTGLSITTEIKRELAKVPKQDKANKLSQLIKVIFDKALIDKDDKMIGRLWAYVDGLPRQQTEIKLDRDVILNIINYNQPKQIADSDRRLVTDVSEQENQENL